MSDYSLDPCVESELWDIWQFIAQDNPTAANRVIGAAFETFKLLAANPHLGSPRQFRNPRLKGIRLWHVSDYEKYLIFYRPIPQGVQIHHICHAARDPLTFLDH